MTSLSNKPSYLGTGVIAIALDYWCGCVISPWQIPKEITAATADILKYTEVFSDWCPTFTAYRCNRGRL